MTTLAQDYTSARAAFASARRAAIAKAKDLWSAGYSGGQIARLTGLSRAAVIALAWRGGWKHGRKVEEIRG